MGVFASWQPRYLERGISTFPTANKTPAVRGWQRIGARSSSQLASRFPDAEEIGFVAGPKSGLTIVDVDSTDEDTWRDAQRRFGETPLAVRTGSGGLHMYFRYAGEPRKIRVEGLVDILGGGVVVGPPSRRGTGYELLRGDLDALRTLPKARNIPRAPAAGGRGAIPEGHRNRALFEHLMREAKHVDELEDLLDVARTFADTEFAASMTDAEVLKITRSAWGYERKGLNRFGAAATVNITRAAVLTHAATHPDAFALLSILQAHHAGRREEFAVAAAMADALGWSVRRFKTARAYLLEHGLLTRTHAGGRGPHDPARYRL